MKPEIKKAIQRAKTCAPTLCQPESVCFLLAIEVERLHALLGTNDIEEPSTVVWAPGLITEPEPTSETADPLWSDYNATI